MPNKESPKVQQEALPAAVLVSMRSLCAETGEPHVQAARHSSSSRRRISLCDSISIENLTDLVDGKSLPDAYEVNDDIHVGITSVEDQASMTQVDSDSESVRSVGSQISQAKKLKL